MPPGKFPAGPRSDSNAYHSIPLVSIGGLVRVVSRLVGAGGRAAGSEQTGGRAERGVGGGGLGGVVSGRGAAHQRPAQKVEGGRRPPLGGSDDGSVTS